MAESLSATSSLGASAKRLIHRLLAIGENRVQLLMVEVQEERNRLVDVIFLSVAVMALALLAGMAWSALLVILVWPYSPLLTLFLLALTYSIAAAALLAKLIAIHRRQDAMAGTLQQLRKDRACLKEN